MAIAVRFSDSSVLYDGQLSQNNEMAKTNKGLDIFAFDVKPMTSAIFKARLRLGSTGDIAQFIGVVKLPPPAELHPAKFISWLKEHMTGIQANGLAYELDNRCTFTFGDFRGKDVDVEVDWRCAELRVCVVGSGKQPWIGKISNDSVPFVSLYDCTAQILESAVELTQGTDSAGATSPHCEPAGVELLHKLWVATPKAPPAVREAATAWLEELGGEGVEDIIELGYVDTFLSQGFFEEYPILRKGVERFFSEHGQVAEEPFALAQLIEAGPTMPAESREIAQEWMDKHCTDNLKDVVACGMANDFIESLALKPMAKQKVVRVIAALAAGSDKTGATSSTNSKKGYVGECAAIAGKGVGKARKSERMRNRWGDGLDVTGAGRREFFPSGWTPSKDVYESVSDFGYTSQELDDLKKKSEDLERTLRLMDITTSCESQIAAINAYTQENVHALYSSLNHACRTPGGLAEKKLRLYSNYLYHLDKSFNTLPNFIGTVFRGTDAKMSPSAYEIGKTITWQQFSSSSKRQQVARKFTTSSSGALQGTMFIINVKSGKEIEMLSDFPEEEEVLIGLNSFFKVEAKLENDQDKRTHLADLAGYDLTGLDVYVLQEI